MEQAAASAITTTGTTALTLSSPLGQRSQSLLVKELAAGFSIETSRKMAAMAPDQFLALTEKQLSTLNRIVTREESDALLRDLALMLPSSAKTPADVNRMLDLYLALFQRHGFTRKILKDACEAYVISPNDGHTRFFPEPGQLFDIARPDLAERKRMLGATTRARETLLKLFKDMKEAENLPPLFKAVEADADEHTNRTNPVGAMVEEIATRMQATRRDPTRNEVALGRALTVEEKQARRREILEKHGYKVD